MIKVFRARDFHEAMVVKAMLEHHNIPAHLDGYYLQGGIGELPVLGLSSVSVPEPFEEQAWKLVQEYLSGGGELETENGDS